MPDQTGPPILHLGHWLTVEVPGYHGCLPVAYFKESTAVPIESGFARISVENVGSDVLSNNLRLSVGEYPGLG